MNLFRFGCLFISALLLVLPASFAKPTPFSLASRHDSHNEIAGIDLRETTSNSNAYHRTTARELSPPPESDRARSLMILGRRDLSQIKQILRTFWDHFVPFDTSALPQAFPVLNAMFSKMQDLVSNLDPGQQLNDAWTFTYGLFEVTIRGAGQAVDVIQEVIEFIREKIIGGMIGFFQANFIPIAGATIVVSYTLIIVTIIWLARFPAGAVNPQDAIMQEGLAWMRFTG